MDRGRSTLVLAESFLDGVPHAVALAKGLHRELAVRQQRVELLEELLGAAERRRPRQQYCPPRALEQGHRLLGALGLRPQVSALGARSRCKAGAAKCCDLGLVIAGGSIEMIIGA